MEQPSNPYITHKLLDTAPRFSGTDKPFKFQERTLNANSRAIDLKALKFDGVARSTAKLLKSPPSTSSLADLTSAGVLHAAACARGEEGKPALKNLLPELEKGSFNLGLLLTIIQIYLSIHNPTLATNVLESFFTRLEQSTFERKDEIRFSPGLIAVAVALYKYQGRVSQATRELQRAASYWRRTPDPPAVLLRSAGAAILESSNPDDMTSAAEIFTKLHENGPEDRMASAGYVASFACTDVSKVRTEVQQLPSVSQLTEGMDVDGLENAGIPQSSDALAIARKTVSRKRGAPGQGLNKPKRIRKSRLPNDYDPSKTPDPERWLPLRDRSTYRPKGKKGKKKDADRTQGGIVANDVGVKDVGPSTQPAGGTGGGLASKKSKKKGKK